METASRRERRGERWVRRAERASDAFGLVLVLVLVTYTLASLIENRGWTSVMLTAATGATSVVALVSSHARERFVRASLALAILAVVLAAIGAAVDDRTWLNIATVIQVSLLAVAMAAVLHRVVTDLPPEKQRMLERLNSSDEDLVDRTVLLVDDDARNIFALSSVLERRGMRVLTATTGNEAIKLIESDPHIAIVLMDIMMPEMDGYQTMEQIRKNPKFRRLPIVALTAKAMKGDREKCLDAGASDYLAKPVNTEQLLSALRGWLHR